MQCILDSYKYNITYLDGGIFLKMMGWWALYSEMIDVRYYRFVRKYHLTGIKNFYLSNYLIKLKLVCDFGNVIFFQLYGGILTSTKVDSD